MVCIILLALLFPNRAQMQASFTLVQSKEIASGAGFTSSIGSGHLVVLVPVLYNSGGTTVGAVTSITETSGGGNSYTSCNVGGSVVDGIGGSLGVETWYVLAAASGSPTFTLSNSGTVSAYKFIGFEYSYSGTAAKDNGSGTTGTGVNITSSSLATLAHVLVVTGVEAQVDINAVPTSFADFVHVTAASTWYAGGSDLTDSGGAGTTAANWSLNSSGNYSQSNCSFKISGGGGSTPSSMALTGVGK